MASATRIVDRDRGYRAAVRAIFEAGGTGLTVGYHEDKRHAAGKGKTTYTATIAAVHEFGSPKKKIPPRPTMGPTADNHRKRYVRFLRDRLRAGIASKAPAAVEGAFALTGALITADVKRAITVLRSPPLKPATILGRARRNAPTKSFRGALERKVRKAGGTNPLVDTGAMRRAVEWKMTRKPLRLFRLGR